jgi:predicted dehydrogenase
MIGWGVLGTGVIASKFAAAVNATPTGRLVAVGSRALPTAETFASQWGVARPYGAYEAVLADPDVDVVYIATPHPDHKDWAIAAAQAGKHLLVEKPLTLNARDTEEVLGAAKDNDVFLLEAFQYRSHPQTDLLVSLLQGGAIGDVRMVQSSFGFHAGFDPHGRLFNPELGGGGIMDVGCYTVSMAVLIARSLGLSTLEATVTGGGHVGSTGVDEWAAATIVFDGRLVAQVETAVSLNLAWVVRVFGSEGTLTVPSPWLPARNPGLVITRPGQPEERREVEATADLFTLEVETVATELGLGHRESPTMPWDDTLATMRILDRWRSAVGVVYPQEAEVQ